MECIRWSVGAAGEVYQEMHMVWVAQAMKEIQSMQEVQSVQEVSEVQAVQVTCDRPIGGTQTQPPSHRPHCP